MALFILIMVIGDFIEQISYDPISKMEVWNYEIIIQ